MADITPIRISQIINKQPKDPVSAADWNEIFNMIIAQANGLSDQLVQIQATITATVVDQLNSLIASGTLSLHVDAEKLGGKLPTDYALQTDVSTLSTAIANTYATAAALTAVSTNATNTYATKTALTAAQNTLQTNINNVQTNVNTTNARLVYSDTAPTGFIGEDVIWFVKG